MEMWNATNVEAQIEHMKNAGMSISAMYGGSGGGGTTAGSGGGSAPIATADGEVQRQAMGLQLGKQAAELALLQAQTKKTEVEAENIAGVDRDNKKETTRGLKFNNDMNDYMRETFIELKDYEATLKGVEAERANALWETDKAAWYGQQDGEQKWAYDSPDAPRVKWLKSEMKKSGEELKAAKIANNIAKAEQTVKEFEAKLTKSGIAPGSPWYMKFLTDLAAKIGINITGDTAKQINKIKK